MSDVLLPSSELAQNLDPWVVLDVRWELSASNPRGAQPEKYAAGHIPGAIFCDLDTHLAGPAGLGGRHPLPKRHELQQQLTAWGITPSTPVVVYDDVKALAASRAWWCLLWAGVRTVRILTGGWAAWQRDGHPTESGSVSATPVTGTPVWPADPLMPSVGAEAIPGQSVVVDVRTAERFRGEQEPIDPVAGHIPGAVNCPIGQVLNNSGDFLPAMKLREVFATLPSGPVTAYCGSGVTASQFVAAGRIAGVPVTLYPGSWSEWITDPSRPVQTATGN